MVKKIIKLFFILMVVVAVILFVPFVLEVLLSILGVILLLILIIVFVPIRYKINVSKGGEVILADGRITWLLRFVNFSFDYNSASDKGVVTKFKLLGKGRDSNHTEENKEEQEEKEKEIREEIKEIEPKIEKDINDTEAIPRESSKKEKKKESFLVKIKRIYKTVYNYPNKKQILKLTKNYIKDLLQNLKPKIFKFDLVLGLDSYNTGKILAGIAALAPHLSFNITGNFDGPTTAIEGNVYTKGKVSVFTILRPTIKYVLKKPIRKLLKDIYKML